VTGQNDGRDIIKSLILSVKLELVLPWVLSQCLCTVFGEHFMTSIFLRSDVTKVQRRFRNSVQRFEG